MAKTDLLVMFLLFYLNLKTISAFNCYREKVYPLQQLGARCSSSMSAPGLPCENAIDGNKHTLWTPAHPEIRDYDTMFFSINLNKKVEIAAIDIMQYDWPHGKASELRIEFPDNKSFSVNFRKSDKKWDRLILPSSVYTDQVIIFVKKTHGQLFGGFYEINFLQCQTRPIYTSTPTYEENPRDTEEISPPMTDDEYSNIKYSSSATIGTIIGVIFGLLAFLFFSAIIFYLLIVARKKKKKGSGDFPVYRSEVDNEFEEIPRTESLSSKMSSVKAPSVAESRIPSVHSNPSFQGSVKSGSPDQGTERKPDPSGAENPDEIREVQDDH